MRYHLAVWPVAIFLLLGIRVDARAATPEPWKADESQGVQTFIAPGSYAGRELMVLIQPAEVRKPGDFNAWVTKDASAVLAALKLQSEGVSPIENGPDYSRLTMKARASDGVYDLDFLAYETQTQRRSIMIARQGIDTSHAAATTAWRFAQTSAKARTMSLLAAPPAIVAIVAGGPSAPKAPSAAAPAPVRASGAAACYQSPFGPSTMGRPDWSVNGTGIGDEKVANVFRFPDVSVGLSGVSQSMHTMILLRDGRFVTNMYASPRDLRPDFNSLNNGTWRKSGIGVDVKWSTGEAEHIDPALALRPAPADLRLVGTYGGGTTTNLASPTGGMTGFAATNQRYTFSADGRFNLQDSVGGAGYGGVGTQSSSNAGRYCIAAWSIFFAFDNGQRDNQLFGLMGTGGDKPQAVFIGSKEFGRQ